VISTPPASCVGTSHAGGIQISPDGRFVYVSNRGHDSVTVFTVKAQAGTIRLTDCVPAGGKKPRFITLDPAGKIPYIANEGSDAIIPFQVDRVTGALLPGGIIIQTGSPVCIVYVDHPLARTVP
jgi:6-phosphogluconolactonase (cycloisomerase 2 family)